MSKKLFSKVFILLLVVGLLFAAAPTGQAQAATVSTWDGTYPAARPTGMADPDAGVQLVNTAEEFAWLASQTNMFAGGVTTVKLMVDIDLADHAWTPSSALGGGMANTFDGNGHTISNLYVNVTNTTDAIVHAAMFLQSSYDMPLIKQLIVDGADVTVNAGALKQGYAGVVASGVDWHGSFQNVTVKNSNVTGTKYVGGIASYNSLDWINCTVTNVTLNVIEHFKADGVSRDLPHVGALVGLDNAGQVYGNTVSNLTIIVTPPLGQPDRSDRIGTLIGTAQAEVLIGSNAISGVTLNGASYTKLIGLDYRTYKVVNATQMIGYTTIQDAVTAAVDGDTIIVYPGTYVVGLQITINKAITLQGQSGAKIQVSGSGYRFLFTAGGTLTGFEIEKTDKTGGQNIIGIQASNVTISDNVIHGQYAMGDPEVARAMEVSGGYSNISITGNTIYSLRQPAYINGIVTGIVQNNVVYNTRGWVVTGGNLTFTGNSWGDGSQPNAVDIAITNDHPDLIGGYYTDIAAMSAANNNAVIEDQRTTPRVLSFVYVDDNAASGGDGTQLKPYQTIQEGIARVVAGGTIHVAAGTYEGFSVVGKTGISITGAGDAQTIIAPTTLITTGVGHKYTPNMLASVFVNGSTGITIEGMAIKSTTAAPGAGGADAIVFWNNSTGFIKESIVLGLYTINGNQTGQGIAVDGGTSVLSLVNTDISGFNKNAIDVVDGNGGTTVPGNLTVNVSGGTITGAGPITATAQNGVSFWNRAGGVLGGSITGATISGFDYTPTTNEATGILAYGLGGGTLTISGNTFGVSEVSVTDITGTLNLYSILTGNTFPPFSGVFGDSIKVSPTKMLMDPATFATTDTCTGTHEVIVKVQDVTDLVAYYLNMTYDKDLITVTSVENLTLVGQATPGNTFENGVINFGWRPVTGVGDPVTYDGNVDLVKITFQSNGLAGTSAFTILPSSALEEWPNAFGIPFEITGGASVSFGSIVTNTSAEPDKAYCDLAVAVAQATSGDTLRVDANITSNVSITIDKALTLNTNSLTISRTMSTTPNNSFAVVPGGNLTITGGGTITASSGTAIRIAGDATTLAKVTLVDATLYAPSFSVAVLGNRTYATHETAYLSQFVMTGGYTNETVILEGNGAEADITGGTLTGWAPIMGNGTVDAVANKNEGGTKITIGGTAVIDGRIGTPSIAIFHPQDGLLTINGGTIIGTNGIEMDAGDLVITGGTIKGTGTCLANPVETPEDGSTDTGDAILILHQPGYTPGDQMHVTISGTPTIESTNCYALRELDFGGANSDLALATISGGHFTGGALGAVYFATNNATNLELVGGDYSADPIAFVYDPYGTYQNAARWYIAPLPVLSSTTFDDQVTLGVATSFSLTVDPSVPGAFSMVFTGYPSETEITYGGTTYYCEGSPCVITVPVTLTGTAQTLEFGITVATGGSETPATSYAVAATLHAPATAYGPTGRDLATLAATVPVTPGFSVSGIVTMQGRTTRAGVPVYLTWVNTLGVSYGPHMDTDEQAVNFRLTVNYGGTYTITTLQPRYLNVYCNEDAGDTITDFCKKVTLTGNYTFANPLWLRAGNAWWQPSTGVYDNKIDGADAQKVFTTWGTAGGTDALENSGDVNFDGTVSIKDLTLVGGNMDLTSATAYSGTTPWLP